MSEFNDNDVSTIVSYVPIEIREFKPGLYPGNFNIDACKDLDHPVIFHVKTSNHVVTIANQRNPLRVETPSFRVAESIVRDYESAQVGLSVGAGPGLAFFMGKLTEKDLFIQGNLKEDDIRLLYRVTIENIKVIQRKWAENLFRMADNDWSRYKNHRSISDLARIFSKFYNIESKEWMDTSILEQIKTIDCPRCYANIDARASVCRECGCIINPEKDKQFTIKKEAVA